MRLATSILFSVLLGSCDPEAGPLPDAIACETDDDCSDDRSFCNGTPVCVEHVTMTARGPWRVTTCDQRANPPCAAHLCDEMGNYCRCETPDADGDGFDSVACGGTDCDDENARQRPSGTEVCDAENLDEDCNALTFGERDADADGYPDAACCNEGSAGNLTCGSDCNDTQAGEHPTAVEACDRRDNDCDGAIDEGVLATVYVDADDDGFGVGEGTELCVGLAHYASIDGDCDDTLSQVHPGAFRCVEDSDIEFCASDATWTAASCPGLGPCVVQPDGTGVCLPGAGSACADGADNDGDGLRDHPDDPGCASPDDNTEETPAIPPACANGLDDDGDGTRDYAGGTGDPGCLSAADTSEREATGPSCDNGLDDDNDTDTDFPDDASCVAPTNDTERLPRCMNGIDDDGDGLIDDPADPGCSDDKDDSERDMPGSNYICDNTLDDDGDGATDYPGDTGCTGPTDSTE